MNPWEILELMLSYFCIKGSTNPWELLELVIFYLCIKGSVIKIHEPLGVIGIGVILALY